MYKESQEEKAQIEAKISQLCSKNSEQEKIINRLKKEINNIENILNN